MLQQGYMNYNDPSFAEMMWKVWSMMGRAFSGFVLRHGRDVLPTWDSIAYWERGTKGPGSGL